MSTARRVILLILLCFLSYSLWHSWTHRGDEKATKPIVQLNTITAQTVDLPQRYIVVETPLYVAHFDRLGGKLAQVALKKYKQSVTGSLFETMLSGDSKHPLYGYLGAKGDERVVFNASDAQLTVNSAGETLTLSGKDSSGIRYMKIFEFDPETYVMKATSRIENTGNQPKTSMFYMGYSGEKQTNVGPKQDVPTPGEFLAGTAVAKQSGFFSGLTTFAGAAYHSSKKSYAKIPYDKMSQEPLSVNVKDAWAAIQKHYFVSAVIPEQNQTYHLSTSWQDGYLRNADNVFLQQFDLFFHSPEFTIQPGEASSSRATFYTGPEIVSNLEGLASGLELTVDYGFLWIISHALFWLMSSIQEFVKNWGLSIILLTALIKLVFYKFSESSYKSMARMKALKPQLDEISSKYKDDAQAKNQAMIEFYRREKLNPLGSCLPLLIQIPFFIAFYNVLVESVELRHVSFLWLPDLAAMDPFYIMPILMGLSMLVQQQLSPQPDDPIQANMMYITPVIFTAMFIAVPSGLVLYWLANNVFSILQQWMVMSRK